jgi:ABC-type antimicrobial peptide transport system permease subunit
LSNTILQGSLLIGEADFKRVFPSVAGYRYFLIDTADVPSPEDQVAVMEEALGDQGFDARSAVGVLRDFMAVQNTYLSTFQSLGGLGLLLGTFGLAAVQVRSVIERTRELGLLRAIGFGNRRIANLIFLESGWLLGVGLGVGILAALFATLPHFLFGSASVPWGELGIIFAIITATGVVTSYVASRAIARRSILKSLRD